MSKTHYIISEKSWNRDLVNRLNDKFSETEHSFELLSSKKAFSATLFDEVETGMLFFPHWSHMISEKIYLNFECIVFHMTDLPFGRGGSPLQNLIVRGYEKTKLSALRVVKEVDAGPIYLKEDLSLEGTAQEIFKKTDLLIEQMIVKIIHQNPLPKEQEGEIVYFKRRTAEESKMNEIKDIEELFDHIRMLDAPTYPKAFFETDHFLIEFSDAEQDDKKTITANVRITKK